MNKVLLIFSYDGSLFHGFQRQKNQVNVQSELENTLSKIYSQNIVIKGAGRTDRGVHATFQCAHFEEPFKIPNLKSKLNKELTNIKINKVTYVSNTFHARYSVKYKIYEYKISFNKNDDSNYYLISKKIDINKIKEASKVFIGTHNFKNFVSGVRDNYETTIYNIKVVKSKKGITIKFKGIGFYRYMVRNLVGAMLDYEKGKTTIKELNDMLINYDEFKQLSTAKANGLYLIKIKY